MNKGKCRILAGGLCCCLLVAAGCTGKLKEPIRQEEMQTEITDISEEQSAAGMSIQSAAEKEGMSTQSGIETEGVSTQSEIETEGMSIQSGAEAENSVFGEFTASDQERNAVTENIFSEYDVTMVYIWTIFSEKCQEQLADFGELNREYQKLSDEGKFQMIGIPVDTLDQGGSASSVELYKLGLMMEEKKADFLQVIPSYDLVMAKLKDVVQIPEILFVDSRGNQIGDSYHEFLDLDDWRKTVDEILEKTQMQALHEND